jgi:hypothetical protein
VVRQLRDAFVLYAFFRSTSAKPYDIDAIVNANCLFALGKFPGYEKVVNHLVAVLRSNSETTCDKWYDNPFVIWYFFSRALSATTPEAGNLITERIKSSAPSNALEAALSAASLAYWRVRPEDKSIEGLLDQQLDQGCWPRAGFYHGGRERLRAGGFAPQHPDTPHWGSEALTTAFCLEVLAKWLEARRR